VPTLGEPTPPGPTPINVALGKAVKASGTWGSNYLPSHVTDGSTAEETFDYWLLPNSTAGWLRVDLGDPYFLDEIRWLNTHNGAAHDRATTDWSLSVSKDGVNYTEVAGGSEPFSEEPSWVVVPCSPAVSYRYLRFDVDGYYGYGGGANEIEAFGTLDNPGAPNVALGKDATASASWHPIYGPGNVTDGSYLEEEIDYWLLPDYSTGWIKVDLGKVYELNKIRWLNTHNNSGNDRATTDWRLEISDDGSNYTEIAGGTEVFSADPSWVVAHSEGEEPVAARYLRL
jgi:hypothetical protein